MKESSTQDLSRELMSESNLDAYLSRNQPVFSDEDVANLLNRLYQRTDLSKAALARQDNAGADRIISSAFRIIAILALPAGVGLSALATPIMVLVLPTQRKDALAAGPHLQVLGIALIFICLMILTNAILQTYGRERIPIFTVIAGGVVKVVMNYILVGNPDINIHGAPISTLCCYMVIVGLNLYFVWKYSPQKPRYLSLFAKPVAASVLMGIGAWAVYGLSDRLLFGGIDTDRRPNHTEMFMQHLYLAIAKGLVRGSINDAQAEQGAPSGKASLYLEMVKKFGEVPPQYLPALDGNGFGDPSSPLLPNVNLKPFDRAAVILCELLPRLQKDLETRLETEKDSDLRAHFSMILHKVKDILDETSK